MISLEELRVRPIREGTVIDHIKAGKALKVLKILGIGEDHENIVSIVMNVPSKKMGKKDIIKLESVFLDKETLNKIALISPKATINIIKDFKVVEKYVVEPPSVIIGIVRCQNPRCITNSEREYVIPKFTLVSKEPIAIRCHYCSRIMAGEEIEKNII